MSTHLGRSMDQVLQANRREGFYHQSLLGKDTIHFFAGFAHADIVRY